MPGLAGRADASGWTGSRSSRSTTARPTAAARSSTASPRCYPDTVTVIHQANSGGPAAPSNRALERGHRPVRLLPRRRRLPRAGGAGAAGRRRRPDGLRRRARPDGRRQRPPRRTRRSSRQRATDIDLFDSALPWALSNTKLFRRELIEKHGIRFPEELPVGSDQPFTLEAVRRAPGGSRCWPTTTTTTRCAGRLQQHHLPARRRRRLRALHRSDHAIIAAGWSPPGDRARRGAARGTSAGSSAKLVGDEFLGLDRETQRAGRATASRELADDVPHRRHPRRGSTPSGGSGSPSPSTATLDDAARGDPRTDAENGAAADRRRRRPVLRRATRASGTRRRTCPTSASTSPTAPTGGAELDVPAAAAWAARRRTAPSCSWSRGPRPTLAVTRCDSRRRPRGGQGRRGRGPSGAPTATPVVLRPPSAVDDLATARRAAKRAAGSMAASASAAGRTARTCECPGLQGARRRLRPAPWPPASTSSSVTVDHRARSCIAVTPLTAAPSRWPDRERVRLPRRGGSRPA